MNLNSNRLITIGITAYNEGIYLQEAWDSVVNQTDDRWKAVLVIDGGADKKTREIFDNIVDKSLTKVVLDKNYGPYYSRTVAINNTKTDWYCHLDGDDRLPKDFTSLILETLKDKPNADLIYGDIQYIKNNKKTITEYNNTNNKLLPFLLYGHVPIKKSIFFELGGFEKKLAYGGADRDFLIKCAINNKKFIYIPNKILYIVRKRNNSVGSLRSKNYKQRELIFKHFNDNYAKFFKINDYYDIFLRDNIKPIFSNLYYKRHYIKLLKYLLYFGFQSNSFLYKHFFNLLIKKINPMMKML